MNASSRSRAGFGFGSNIRPYPVDPVKELKFFLTGWKSDNIG